MSINVRHRLGAIGETLAAAHLERLGCRVLERNYRTRWGELDIVADDGSRLIFIEVKTRTAGGRAGTAIEAVSTVKRAQVRRIAARWLVERRDRPHREGLRFDAIAVTVDGGGRLLALDHFEGAF